MSNFIYRAIREDEDISRGIEVPYGEKAETQEERARRLEYHIQNGSKDSYKSRYFISMTEKLETAQKYRIGKEGTPHKKSRIVLIYTKNIPTELIRISNIEGSSIARFLEESTMVSAKNYSAADSEVLSDDNIGAEHCKEISPLMLEVFDAINVTIAKDDENSKNERELLEFVQTAFFESDEFEQILHDTTELSVYEQYFFDRFYRQGMSMEEIASEMNNAIEQREGKKIDLTVLESLRVGTIKKLLNSDRTLDYLKKYNDEKYKSEEISSQLDGAISEKETTKCLHEKNEMARLKLRRLENYIKINENKIKELESEVKVLEKQAEEISVQQETKESGFYGNLRANVYSPELAEINLKKMKAMNDIKLLRTRIVEYQQISIEIKRSTYIELPEKSNQLAAKYHGIVIRNPNSWNNLELFSERPKRTTATKSMFEKMENSNGRIAYGETAYSIIELNEELVYTGGSTSSMRRDDRGTVLVCFSSEWRRKETGGPRNYERVGKRRITLGKDTSFGLDELLLISEKRRFVSRVCKKM